MGTRRAGIGCVKAPPASENTPHGLKWSEPPLAGRGSSLPTLSQDARTCEASSHPRLGPVHGRSPLRDGNCTCEHGLARARRPMQQQALGRTEQLRLAEEVWSLQRKQQCPPDLVDLFLEPANVREGDACLWPRWQRGGQLDLIVV
eukprot:scaffold17559_cov110-Isochrysis_galbana.AAC.2